MSRHSEWVIEGASGPGALSPSSWSHLVFVIDVHRSWRRERALDNEQADKSNRHDPRSAAIVALGTKAICTTSPSRITTRFYVCMASVITT